MNDFPYHHLRGSKPLPDLQDPKLKLPAMSSLGGFTRCEGRFPNVCHRALRHCAYLLHLITTLADSLLSSYQLNQLMLFLSLWPIDCIKQRLPAQQVHKHTKSRTICQLITQTSSVLANLF